VRFASPLASLPRTLRPVVVPVTGLGLALAACATVGVLAVTPTLTSTLLVVDFPPSEMVTVSVYTPDCTNVAVVFLPALVPLFASNVGAVAPVGTTEANHVYVRLASPPSSPPRTLRLVVVPDTGFGEAAAAVTTNGALSTVTFTLALLLTLPDDAVTLN